MHKIFPPKKQRKLYDLMLMVFKYQVVNCHHAEDILLVTLNHLDAIKACAKPYTDLSNKVKHLYSLLITNYGDLSYNDYDCLYKYIDAFLQDINIRVSVLMKLGLQLPSGEIVINKSEELQPRSREKDKLPLSSACFDFDGERNFTLGTNIYILSAAGEPTNMPVQPNMVPSENIENPDDKELQGIEELSLLTRLIGKCIPSDTVPEIMLASPSDESYELDGFEVKESCSVVKIDASQKSKQDLEKICNDLVINVDDRQKFDILELLDTVETNNI